MGRTPRQFTEIEIKEMTRLFNAGENTDRIGEVFGCSGTMVRRVLKVEIGDLRTARAMAKARAFTRQRPAEGIARQLGKQVTSEEYREGFAAGYRLALGHVKIHGREAAHKHWRLRLLSWVRDGADDVPPELLTVYRGY